jgi:hypothetical protein
LDRGRRSETFDPPEDFHFNLADAPEDFGAQSLPAMPLYHRPSPAPARAVVPFRKHSALKAPADRPEVEPEYQALGFGRGPLMRRF